MDTIFFILSKVVQFCIEPLNWAIVFVLLGMLFLSLRKPELCKRFLFLTLLDLFLVGWLPASELPLRAIENLVSKAVLPKDLNNDIGGIIILGGSFNRGEIMSDREEVSLRSSAERVTKGFELIRKNPTLPYIFSGYSGRIIPRGMSEADAFKQLVQEQGLNEEKAHYEKQSRNTYENVLFMKPMIEGLGSKDQAGQLKPWLLITSASHMYRSMKIFEKQGLPVLPVPVDYQTANRLQWTEFDLVDGAQNWNDVVHELVGLIAYWITGKI